MISNMCNPPFPGSRRVVIRGWERYRVSAELKILDQLPPPSLRRAAKSLLVGIPFVARLGSAREPEVYAKAARADALALDLVRALARADAARDHLRREIAGKEAMRCG
jgi:hypothetical protein